MADPGKVSVHANENEGSSEQVGRHVEEQQSQRPPFITTAETEAPDLAIVNSTNLLPLSEADQSQVFESEPEVRNNNDEGLEKSTTILVDVSIEENQPALHAEISHIVDSNYNQLQNYNSSLAPSKYSLPFFKNRSLLEKLPLPRFRTVIVAHVFGGFLTPQTQIKRNTTKVKFAPEIVQVADLKKDVAGKERVVPRTNKPKRKGFRKVVDSSGNILCNPDEETSDMYGVWYIVSENQCPCGFNWPCGSRHTTRSRPSLSHHVSNNYRIQAENFSASLEHAGLYFDGNMLTANGAAEVFHFPMFNLMTEGLNYPASKIWLFTYALTALAHTTGQPPAPDEFQFVVHHFYQIGRLCEQVCDNVCTYYELQMELEPRIIHILSKMLIRLRIRLKPLKTSLTAKSVWKKRILKLSKHSKIIQDSEIAIMMGGIWDEPDLKWGNFKGYPLDFRLQALQSLLNDVDQCIRVVHSQTRFLAEDIKAGKFEDEDTHIVNVLILMDSVLKFFVRSNETTVTHEKNLRQVVRSFVKDTFDFLHTARFVVEKALELRDTMQLCHAYISKHFRSTVAAFKTLEKEASVLSLCCDRLLQRQYEYRPEDFFRTSFQRVLQMFYVNSGRAFMMLRYEKNEELAIEKIKVASAIEDEYDTAATERLKKLESIFSESIHSFELEVTADISKHTSFDTTS